MSTESKTWADQQMCAWDTETTGTDPEAARIVTSATASIAPGQTPQTTEWLLDPGVEIPEQAAEVHGVTTEHARQHGVAAAAGVEAIVQGLMAEIAAGTPLVIYNAPYDLTVLDRECRRHGLKTLSDRCNGEHPVYVIDPLVLDKKLDKWRRGSRKLVDVAAHYGITLTDAEAHTAAGDCLAAARTAWKIARTYPEVGKMRLGVLVDYQARAFAEQAESFERYLREKKGQADAEISREWPIRAAKEAQV